jgi:TetR/AcrR family transcriptional regulator, lmrAB and yxaGH operons repressor
MPEEELRMARPQLINDETLLDGLSVVFRDVGYEGASLAKLAEATGLKRASLYHRFPGGKEQMASEVLQAASNALSTLIIRPLLANIPVAERMTLAKQGLTSFYKGGQSSCLLNMLSSPHGDGPFAAFVSKSFHAIIDAFATAANAAGFERRNARVRALMAVSLIHGALVVSRGLNSTEAFSFALEELDKIFATS